MSFVCRQSSVRLLDLKLIRRGKSA